MCRNSSFTKEFATELINSFNGTLHYEIERINSGGCGVFALETARLLKQYGFDVEIWIADFTWAANEFMYETSLRQHCSNITHIQKSAIRNQKAKNGKAADHLLVQVGNVMFDSEQVWEVNNDENIEGQLLFTYNGAFWQLMITVSDEVLNHMVYELPDKWNPIYDRSQNELMKTMIEIQLDSFIPKLQTP